MTRRVTSEVLREVAGRRKVWRWTDLHDAIQTTTGCCSATARRTIARALQGGLLKRVGGAYSLADQPDSENVPPSYRRLDRLVMLRILASREQWTYTTMLTELCRSLCAAQSTVRASLQYARDFGYLERVVGGWRLTDHSRHLLEQYGRLEGAEGFRFATFLSGHPKRGYDRWR